MAKVGRNDPCPCGSGKKYKKCCLEKDEEQNREARGRVAKEALQAMANLPQLPILSPEQVAAEELWNRFTAADYDGRIAIFLETLDAGEIDEEWAFEMLSDIWKESKDEARRERFQKLVARLEQEAPDAYESEAHHYNGWMLEDAIIRGEMSRVPALLEVLGRNLDRSIDVFFQAIDQMMYYGQIQTLIHAMIAAWPAVDASSEIVSWAKEEFVNTAIGLILFHHLDRGGIPSADDLDLRAALSPLPVDDWSVVDRNLALLSGGKPSNWTLADFDAWRNEGMAESNFFLFSLDWMGELWRRHGIPFGKGELARVALVHYQDRCLEKGKSGLSVLVPHPQFLEGFIAEHFFHFLGYKPYKAASLMELLPFYLRFLVERGLLESTKAEASLRSLWKLQAALVRLLGSERDPNLAPAVERAWR